MRRNTWTRGMPWLALAAALLAGCDSDDDSRTSAFCGRRAFMWNDQGVIRRGVRERHGLRSDRAATGSTRPPPNGNRRRPHRA